MADEIDYKYLCEEYEQQIEVYKIFYQDRMRFSMALLSLSGIITQMVSDNVTYQRKHGLNDKIKPAIQRAESLEKIYEDLNGLDQVNQQYRFALNQKNKRVQELEDQVEELKKQLKFNQE